MADIFREVDEEVRRDKAAEIWKKYQNWIIAAAVVAVAASGGWRWYEHERRTASEAANMKFQEATQLAQAGKPQEAEAALNALASKAPPGYAALARLRAAGEAAGRDAQDGIKAFDALGGDATLDRPFRELARLRAGLLAIDKDSYDDARKRLEPLSGPDGIFRHTAREALALSAFKAENFDAAAKWLDMLITDSATPQATRQRAGTLQALVFAGRPAKP